MHPILLNKVRLGLYLLAWAPGVAALSLLLTRDAHFAWTQSILTATGLVMFYALVCLSPWYSCQYLPFQPSQIPKLLLNHTAAALVAAALCTGIARMVGRAHIRSDAAVRCEQSSLSPRRGIALFTFLISNLTRGGNSGAGGARAGPGSGAQGAQGANQSAFSF